METAFGADDVQNRVGELLNSDSRHMHARHLRIVKLNHCSVQENSATAVLNALCTAEFVQKLQFAVHSQFFFAHLNCSI